MNVREEIQSCEKCMLYKNMTISPVATEIFGKKPVVMFICSSSPKEKNDLSQEVITGTNRAILANMCDSLKIDYATTFLMKCKKNSSYTKNEIKKCSTHIFNECRSLGIRHLVVMGKPAQETILDIKLSTGDYFFEPIITSAPNILFNNTVQINNLRSQLKTVV
jgi:uracil-DNA glycosylase